MAITFNGSTNLLEWAGNIKSSFPITFFAWAKRANTNSLQSLLSTGGPGDSTRVALETIGYQLNARVFFASSAGYYADAANSCNSEFGWNPIMGVVTSDQVKIYYGSETDSGTASHGYSDTLSSHTSVIVGGTHWGDGLPSFIGDICECAFWSTALGDAEWATLKTGTPPEGVASGSLIEAWPLRELGEYTGVNGRTLVATGTLARSATDPFVRSSPAATATTLSGPSSGTTGVASTNFTVGANGTITGTVTVTPSDAGNGGTFTPTTVAISSGTPTATFTYTPASTGSKTISISDDGGLTDATSLTYTSNAPADTTAPTLTSPTGTATGSTTASGTVSTNEANGTLYWLCNTSSTATLSAVKAGSSQAVSATGSQSVSVTGLTASTTYYLHYAHTDAAANDSSVANSASFATDAVTYPRITTPVLKDFSSRLVVASEAGITVNVLHPTTSVLVLKKTGLASDATGVVTFTDVALSAATEYAYEVVRSNGKRLLPLATTT